MDMVMKGQSVSLCIAMRFTTVQPYTKHNYIWKSRVTEVSRGRRRIELISSLRRPVNNECRGGIQLICHQNELYFAELFFRAIFSRLTLILYHGRVCDYHIWKRWSNYYHTARVSEKSVIHTELKDFKSQWWFSWSFVDSPLFFF